MTGNDVGPYVDWAMAMLKRWKAKGLEPALYAPLNEPEINNDYSPQWLHDVVVQLGQRLRATPAGERGGLASWRRRAQARPASAVERDRAVARADEVRAAAGALTDTLPPMSIVTFVAPR